MRINRSNSNQLVCAHLILVGPVIFSLGLIAFLQPWWLPDGLHVYDYQRWVEAFTLTLAGAAQVCAIKIESIRKKYFLCVVSLLFLASVSAALSSIGWVSWVGILRLFLWSAVILSLPFVLALFSKEQLAFFCASTAVPLFFYAAYTVIGTFVLLENGVYHRVFVVSGFANVNHAAGFLMLATLLMPVLSVESSRFGRAFPFLCGCAASVFLFLLIVIGSRGSWLAGSMALLSLVVIFRGSASRRYLAKCGNYLVAGIALFLLMQGLRLLQGIDGAVSAKSITSDSGRVDLYLTAIKGVLVNPWFGQGLLSFSADSNSVYGHPHNIVLSSLYELGIPFTLLATIFAGALAVRLVSDRKEIGGDFSSVGGMAVVVSFLVHSQFSGLSMIPATLVIVAIGGGLAFRRLVLNTDFHRRQSCSVSTFAVFSACSIAYILALSLYWADTSEDTKQKTRFWLNGDTAPWLKNHREFE